MGVYRVSPTCARRGRDSGRGGCSSRRSGEYYADTKEGSKGNNRFYLWHVASDVSRWLSYALVIWFIFLPSIALAEPVIEVSNFAGYEDGETYTGYVVCDSPNAYTSSIVLIGEYAKLIQVDSVMYAKLSDPVKGGAFYALTQKWQHIGTNGSGSASNYPSWLAMSRDFADGLNVVYGYDRNWACVVTATEVADALRDFNLILEGGDVEEEDETVNSDGWYEDSTYYYIPWTKVLYESDTEQYEGICVLKSYNPIEFFKELKKKGLGLMYAKKTNSIAFFCAACKEVTYVGTTITITDYTYNTTGSGGNRTYNGKEWFRLNLEDAKKQSMLDGELTEGDKSKTGYVAYYFSLDGSSTGEGGDDEPITPVDPPEDPLPTQPDPTAPDPDTPTVPRFPEPVDPDVEPDPQPVLPDPEPTVTPPDPTNRIVYEPTNTTPNDYTPWLRAILLQLQQLLEFFSDFAGWLGDEMASHCLHIREHMSDCLYDLEGFIGELLYEYTDDLLKTIAEYAYWLGNNNRGLLAQHHTYLTALAQWIVDNLRWEGTAGEYDDSNVLYWLKRIWAKQGNGTVNTKPNDPVTNYNIYVTWLGDLFGDIAVDLGGLDLSSLMQALEGLSDVFPFSIPWNVIAVFGLLSANAITPSFDFTIPATDYFGSYSYEIDLQWLDGAMVSVRAIELLAFVCYVLVHTKDFCGFLLGGDD